MIIHLALRMTATPKLSKAIVTLCAYIVMFEKPLLEVNEEFSSDSPTRKFKDENKCLEIAAQIYHLKRTAQKLLIPTYSKEGMKAHIAEIMEMNGVKSKERFLGEFNARPVLDLLYRSLPFAHVYLQSVSEDGQTGVLVINIIHDAELDGAGLLKPVYGGEFVAKVGLPFKGTLENPLYERHPDATKKGNENKKPLISEYLGYWLSMAPIWSRALPNLIEMCTGTKGKSSVRPPRMYPSPRSYSDICST